MGQERRVIIHCGATRVTYLEMLVNGGNEVLIEDLATEALDYDFTRDEDWMAALFAGLERLRGGRKVKVEPEFIAPGFRILTKVFRIPHVEPGKRRQIIAFEAQQKLPYSVDEVVWDAQEVADDGIETEVLFLAAKKEGIESFCAEAKRLGLNPAAIVPSPVLDYNAFQFLQRDYALPALLTHIGARSTNLTFIHKGGFTVRTVNLGGNQLTQPIADNLGCSFQQAESLKTRFFTEKETFSDEDPRVRMIHREAEQFRKRLGQEITRSVLQFRRQCEAGPPVVLWLCGGGALLPGLEAYLSEKQRVPCHLLWMGDGVVLAPTVETELWGGLQHHVVEAIGSVVRDRIPNGVGTDLLPKAFREQRRFCREKPWYLAGAALLTASCFLPWIDSFGEGEALEARVASLQGEIRETETLLGRQVEGLDALEAHRAAIDSLDRSLSSRTNWMAFFAELQGILREVGDVWLDDLEVTRRIERIEPPPPETPEYDVYGELVKPEPMERIFYRLNLSGKMLLRENSAAGASPVGEDYNEQIITSRIRAMIEELSDSEFVKESGVPTVFWTRLEDGVLPFSFNLTVNPEKPL
mgnify:FL=1